jgi:choline dehydrogenase-like flavoprotein
MIPSQDNYVRLHPERKDQFGFPVLDIHLRFGAEVPPNIRDGHTRLQSILADAGYQSQLTTPVEEFTPGWAAHYGGTVRMHASPEYGMLDGWNRLHEVDNVAVVDASSFTTGAEKNPTLTVMALAARAADRLADDLKRGDLAGRRGTRSALSTVR